nr:hypothetical protein [Tanacetum cinerariifolium]
MQEELLQFKIQKVWSLVDCPKGVRPIGTKWVLKNKKDERGIGIRNKARLVAQGHTHEEGIDYAESAFLYGTIDEEVYMMQPPRFQDPEYPARVYKVEKAIDFEALMHEKLQMSAMGELNFFLGLSSNTPMDKENPWEKDGTGKDVDLHLYRSMIGSLMYLTASRPDIMFAVCAYARHQVTPEECHLHVVKRIFRYLKGHPKLGLWYPKDSPFDLVAYSDSDYGGATQDRKSTTGGCQFLGRRLISWQYKKQKIVATSTTETEDVGADSCYGQVMWIQNQLLDYGNLIMARLQFCDYHNMVAILEKSEHNIDFHSMVYFVKASPLRIVPLFDTMLTQQGEGLGTPTEPHHTPSQEEQPLSHTYISSPSIPTVICTAITPIRQYTRRTRIAQSSVPLTEVEINRLKERVKQLEVKEGVAITNSGDGAPIKGRSMNEGEAATERVRDDIEEMATVEEVPTASPVFATATVVTPYRRRKGKEVMVESETPKKQKVQKQIDAQVARELEEQLAREDQRRAEQIAKDAEIARIHAEEELQSMIDGLDSNNKTIAKYLEEYRWKVKDFKGMTFEEVEAKFNSVCKQMEDFIPMGSKEEAKRIKRKGKKQKSSEEITEEAKSPEEVTEGKIKEMMQLIPIEEVYVETLQVKHPIID